MLPCRIGGGVGAGFVAKGLLRACLRNEGIETGMGSLGPCARCAYLRRLSHHLGWRPLRIAAMRARHVFGGCGVPIANGRERMARDTLTLVEDLHRRAGDACV